MGEVEKFKKLRLIRKFLFDLVIDQNAIYGIITTHQDIANEVSDLMKERIKSDKQINQLYRSAIRHLSFKAYTQAIA